MSRPRLAFEGSMPAWERLENSFAWHDKRIPRKQIAQGLASAEERAALPPHLLAHDVEESG